MTISIRPCFMIFTNLSIIPLHYGYVGKVCWCLIPCVWHNYINFPTRSMPLSWTNFVNPNLQITPLSKNLVFVSANNLPFCPLIIMVIYYQNKMKLLPLGVLNNGPSCPKQCDKNNKSQIGMLCNSSMPKHITHLFLTNWHSTHS